MGKLNNDYLRTMGIINVSPESYYKQSVATDFECISRRARILETEGADIIDIGAMSTAPYLVNMTLKESEEERMRMAIKAVRNSSHLPISIDTPRADVAKLSIDLGADIINDVTGLKYDKSMAKIISEFNIPIIIGAYNSNEYQSKSGGIIETIADLKHSIEIACDHKIPEENMIVDPSIGFYRKEGNNPFFTRICNAEWYERDLTIISNLEKLGTLLKPICISVSNKSFIGQLFGFGINDRLIPSLVFEILCLINGASIIRTHNVKQTRMVIKTIEALPPEVIERLSII